MKKKKQLVFSELKLQGPTEHGGEHSISRRKKARPISIKKPMHVVMRASKAKGTYSLRTRQNKIKIESLTTRYAKRFHIKLYQFTINFNHIHIALKAKQREDFQNFLRALAGNIAVFILKAKRGLKRGKFWDLLAFSRIVEWGSAFKILMKYVLQNELEASGQIPYQPRKVQKKPP